MAQLSKSMQMIVYLFLSPLFGKDVADKSLLHLFLFYQIQP